MHVASFLRETRCWFGVIRKLRKIIDLLIQVRYLVEVSIRLGTVFLSRWEEIGWNSTKIWRKKNWIATYGIPNVLRHKLELQWMKSAYRIKLITDWLQQMENNLSQLHLKWPIRSKSSKSTAAFPFWCRQTKRNKEDIIIKW